MEGDGSRDVKDQKSQPIKRTFCNAFTGCQGKRSDASAGAMKDYDYGHESVKEGTDENFVGDVARDILAEARLWEALQARNSMRYPVMRKQGFFGREKRATKSEEGGFNRIAPHNGIENRNNE
ncbi:Cardioactive peptide [Orchesella cincta]|uniref:Cardioactive peptide n=1 Tax=Orchesella cincta TaxID=48709 RepID=A0A1D2N024_ORCCI|nr:Cardioactive peptide [Orchesella cincta]